MKNKLSIQQRLILPIILLGAVALISNILSVFSVNNVNSNASKIVDNYMVGSELLQNIRHTTTNIHKMALSHIVATDYDTMISVVAQIKEQEEILEAYLEEYEKYVAEDEKEIYSQLLNNYDSFKRDFPILIGLAGNDESRFLQFRRRISGCVPAGGGFANVGYRPGQERRKIWQFVIYGRSERIFSLKNARK